MKNGKIRFCYEIGDAPCRACDIGDTIDYFLDEDISPTIDAVSVVRCKDCKHFDGLNCKVNDITNIMDTNWFCADGERQEGR
jgi:hypothetical protein